MSILGSLSKTADRFVRRFVPPAGAIVPAIETPALPSQQVAFYGDIPTRTPMNVELGVSGLKQWYGRVSDTEEFLPELQGERGKRTYQEMAENDPTISAGLWLIEQMIKQTKWHIKPVDDIPEEIERANHVESCLSDMYVPWDEFLSETITMCTYGFSLFESVMKIRRGDNPGTEAGPDGVERPLPISAFDDGKIGWHKLAPRAQEYTFRWLIDDKGDILGIVQWAPPLWQQVVIPYEKLIHFKLAGRRHNPEGRALLRGAYTTYRDLKALLEIEAIGIERDLCGLPMASIDEEVMRIAAGTGTDEATVWAKQLVAAMKQLVTRVKNDEQSGIVFPLAFDEKGHQLYDFKLLSSSGSRTIDIGATIARKKQEIASSFLADVMLMGHNQVGSYSLADSKTSLLVYGVAGIMDNIKMAFNRKAIPQLCTANGWKPLGGGWPELEHGDIETPDLGVLGAYITALGNAGITGLDDPQVVKYLFGVANLPTNVHK